MRVCVTVLGWTLDWSLEPSCVDVEAEDDGGRDLGYVGGTFLSFTSGHPVPEEITAPQHCPSWDEPEDRNK